MNHASAMEAGVMRKLTLRLILPFLALIVLNSLDRVNVGFAAVRMNAELGLTPQTYGLGISLFFAGYIGCQLPSLWLLQRYGMRRWITGVIFTWGLVATAMAFVQDATSFFTLRFLLGVTEAGFAPGVTVCCAAWVPKRFRGGAISKTMVAIPISVIVGGPLSGWMMDTVTWAGWASWRWMILLEGLPAIVLGIAAWWYFVDRPALARWLTADEKTWLDEQLALERGGPASQHPQAGWRPALRELLGSRLLWACACTWCGLLTGAYGLIYWLPLVIKEVSRQSNFGISLLSALPWIGVAAGMLLNARHSDRTLERHLHVALPTLLAAIGLACAAAVGTGAWALLLLVAGGYGLGAAQGTFWTVPTGTFAPQALPTGVALVNMAGNLGGLLGPWLIGLVRHETGTFDQPVYAIAALLAISSLALLTTRPRTKVPSR